MKWSVKVGRIAGIDVFIHSTFLLLIAWLAFMYYVNDVSLTGALFGFLFVIVVFAIVVLHELGHALAARRLGISTFNITLLPIGGVARLERLPDDPVKELAIAIAGPAVNAGLAIVFLASTSAFEPAGLDALLDVYRGSWWVNLFWVNVILAVFNLIPAFPMDGGRVLRAILAMHKPYVAATRIATYIGQAFAILFAVLGIFINPFLILIAFFVWIAGSDELRRIEMGHLVKNITISKIMITRFQTLSPLDPVEQAVRKSMSGFQQDFPVVLDGVLLGIVTREGIMAASLKLDPTQAVGDIMRRQYESLNPRDTVDQVLSRIQSSKDHLFPVIDGEQLVGVVTPDRLSRILLMRKLLRRVAYKKAQRLIENKRAFDKSDTL